MLDNDTLAPSQTQTGDTPHAIAATSVDPMIFMPMVKRMVNALINRSPWVLQFFTREDLEQESLVAVISAISNYDSERGTKLSTFVYSSIRARLTEMRRAAVRQGRCVAIDDLADQRNSSEERLDDLKTDGHFESVNFKMATLQILQTLPPVARDVFLARCFHKKTYHDLSLRYRTNQSKVYRLYILTLEYIRRMCMGESAHGVLIEKIKKACSSLGHNSSNEDKKETKELIKAPRQSCVVVCA